jgi:F-type H+-transporting ATPase subunit b
MIEVPAMAGETVLVAQAEHTDATTAPAHGAESLTAETQAIDAHAETFPPFDPATFGSQLLWLAITFGALYLLMSRIALPRIGEILEIRRDRIEGDLAEADRLRQKTDQAIEAYEAALANARQKAHGIAEETRSELKRETEKSRAEVEADLTARVSAAEQSIQATKTEALKSVDEIAAQTAVSVVTALTGKVSIAEAREAVAAVVKG